MKYLIKGKYEVIGTDKIHISELPIGVWTDDFKSLLESLTETSDSNGKKVTPIVKDYDDMSKDTNVNFTITLHKGKLSELESKSSDYGCNSLEKVFKLYTTSSTSNMHLFDAEDKLKKYTNVSEIINDYYTTRLDLYRVRKEYLIDTLTEEVQILSNKANYIQEVLNSTIDLRKKTKEQVYKMLEDKKYDKHSKDDDYKYLIKMPMDSVTEENVAKIIKDYELKMEEIEEVKSTTIQEMWLKELDTLHSHYIQYSEERQRSMKDVLSNKTKSVSKVKKIKTKLK